MHRERKINALVSIAGGVLDRREQCCIGVSKITTRNCLSMSHSGVAGVWKRKFGAHGHLHAYVNRK